MSAIHAVLAGSHAGSSGPSWSDNYDPALITSQSGGSFTGQMYGGLVVAGFSGACTKIRFRCHTANGPKTGKIALLTTGGVIVGSGTYSGATSGAWVEANITSAAVTGATSYIVMYSASSNVADTAGYRFQSNGGRENYDQSYGTFPNGTVPLSNTNNQICAGLYITP